MTIRYFDTAGSNTAPYDTLAKAATDPQTIADLAVAGDTNYYVGTFVQITKLDFDINSGTSASPILNIGVNALGVEDGTPFTLDGNSSALHNVHITNVDNVQFRNFKGINATGTALECTGTVIGSHRYNCEWSSSGLYGVDGNDTSNRLNVVKERTNNNADTGSLDATREGHMFGCEAIGNGLLGIRVRALSILLDSLAHNNVSDGVQIFFGTSQVWQTTSDGNGGSGIWYRGDSNGGGLNRLTNNTSYGTRGSALAMFFYKNAYYNNTAGESLSGGGLITDWESITLTSDGYINRAMDNFGVIAGGEGVGLEVEIGGNGATTTGHFTSGGIPPEYSSGGGSGVGRAYPRGVA